MLQSLLLSFFLFLFVGTSGALTTPTPDIEQYSKAKDYYKNKFYVDAATEFGKIPSSSILFDYANYYQVQALIKQKAYKLAKDLFSPKIRVPYLAQLINMSTVLSYYNGNSFSNDQYYKFSKFFMSIWEFGEAFKCLNKLPTSTLQTEESQYMLAQCYAGMNQKDQATKIYTDLPASAKKFYYLANLSSSNEKINYYKDLIKNYPNSSFAIDAAYTVFRYFKDTPTPDKALEYLDFLESFSEHKVKALFEKGLLSFELADYPKALELFKSCDSGDYQEASLFWQYKSLTALERIQEATQLLLHLQKDFPLSYYSYRAYAYNKKIPATNNQTSELVSTLLSQQVPARLKALIEAEAFDDAFIELTAYYKGNDALYKHFTVTAIQKNSYHSAFNLSGYFDQPSLSYPLAFIPEITAVNSANIIDAFIVLAIIREESNFNPFAISGSGARGLMQLMPATATYIADKMKIPTYNLNTPTDNIRFGVIHFNYLYKTLGILKGVASYNCGQGALGKFKKHNDIDLFLENIPKSETRLYVKKVMKSYWNYNLLYNKSLTPQILF